MSIKNKYYLEIWIGLAKVKSDTKEVLGDAIGAYVNVLGLSNNKSDFRRKVNSSLQKMGLTLLRLENVESFSERVSRFKVDPTLKKIANQILESEANIQFGKFHVYN